MNKEIADILDMDGFNRTNSYLKNKYPTCKKCDSYMYLDDIDKDFDGKQDEYWFCPKCSFSMTVKVRFNKVYGITYKEFKNG